MANTPEDCTRRFERKQIVFSALGLLLLIGISIIANTLHMRSVAKQSTGFISRMIQFGEFREVGVTLQDARLEYFRQIQYQSVRPGRSFTLPELSEHISGSTFLDKFSSERVTISTNSPLSSENSDQVTFEYDRFRLVPYSFVIWIIFNLVSIPQTRYIKKRLIEEFKRERILERSQVKAEIARQVRHNLRTPLAALTRIPARIPDAVSSDRELLKSSILQIRTLISKLDENQGTDYLSESTSDEIYDSILKTIHELAAAVEPSIKFSYEIEDTLVSAKVPHIPHELRALLGNIVNNALDAIEGLGTVILTAKDMGAEVLITIQDSGRGIAPDIIDKVFIKGFSSGKEKGFGLGLHHAKDCIESWGGRISASSILGESTTISICLPIESRAKWYVPRLKFSADSTLVILDDQLTARHLWRQRLFEAGMLEQAHIFEKWHEVCSFLAMDAQSSKKPTFLFDYDLGAEKNGLDLLAELPGLGSKYLVTGHFDLPEVRTRCEHDGVYLLPKSEIANIPIVLR